MILWLDDIRQPWNHGYIGAQWAKTYEDAIRILETGKVTFASLDHDLSEAATMGCASPGEKTGYSVICWLEDHPQFWPVDGVKVHSMNPSGAMRMRQVIEAHYGRRFDSLRMQEIQKAMIV